MDWQAFATSFMTDQAQRIQARLVKSSDYEDKLRDDAEKSKALFGKRKLLVDQAVAKSQNLKKLGVSDEQIAAAAASGPEGLFNFANEIEAYAKKTGKTKFIKSELDALIETPELLKEQLGDDFKLNKFLKQTYGMTEPSLGSTERQDRNFLQQALGIGGREAVRAKLDEEAYFEGYSIVDINELANSQAFTDLLPGGSFRFLEPADYNSAKIAGDFEDDLARALKNRETDINSLEVGSDARKNLIKSIKDSVVRRYANMPYGQQFLKDTSLDLARRFPDVYQELLVETGAANLPGPNKNKDGMNIELTAAIEKTLMDEVAETGVIKDANGKATHTYRFMFDEKGFPVSGMINGVHLTPELAIEAFKDAQNAGLFKDKPSVDASVTELDLTKEEMPPANTNIVQDAPVVDTKTNTSTLEPEAVQTQTEEKVEKLKVKPYKLSDGRTLYIITNEEGIRAEGTPAFSTYEAAQGAIVANESPSMARELDPVEPEVFSSASSDIYDNPTDATYLVKIDGMLGTFRVKADDLQYIPREKVKVGKASSEQVSIMVDEDPDKRRKSLSGSRLRRMFRTKKGLGDTETTNTMPPKEEMQTILQSFEDSLTDKTKAGMIAAWPKYAEQAGINPFVADQVLAALLQGK
tara:strand:- start:397 stop:2313 length:1917 start_codon:yes stop_codon:yes gene_type:complete